ERLLSGFRWILVDEYQDIGPEQYDLLSALAGRTLQEEASKLTMFAVGDDDQNIYAFDGASVEFIRRFEADYAAKPSFLLENFRSSQNIITTANLMIAAARHRMKLDHPITIDRARKGEKSGGQWQTIDPVGKGKVQLLNVKGSPADQAVAVMTEFNRLAELAPVWDWNTCAIIAREWKFLEPVRAWCELQKIPVQMADEDTIQFWRLRETQALVSWVRARESKLVSTDIIYAWLETQPSGQWWWLLKDAIDAYVLEASGEELPSANFVEWLAEWGRDLRRKQSGLLLLTAHRAKGLEFDHVAVLDGAWEKKSSNEDKDAARRLYYVAMTRAKQTLLLAQQRQVNPLLNTLPESPAILIRPPMDLPTAPNEMHRRYMRLSMKDIDISFAGRYSDTHPVHRAIAGLETDDSLLLKKAENKWVLKSREGTVVCRLAKAFTPPSGKQFVSAKVLAVIVRQREDSEPEYQDTLQCNRWEVVIPELIFE
ncbi:MAG: ATP-dependent helicase, partial [Pseudohongiellaceae bacterium]